MANVFLLSVKQEEAQNIFSQKKTIELRKMRPKIIDKDDLVIIYATTPIKAFVGILKIKCVVEQKTKIWQLVQHEVTLKHFQTYCRSLCTAVFFKEAWQLPHPIAFKKLQKQHFIPPRGFRLASKKEIELFLTC